MWMPRPSSLRDGLGERDLGLAPRARCLPVDGEHADRAVERGDRGREHRARAEPEQRLERLALELLGARRPRRRSSRVSTGEVGRGQQAARLRACTSSTPSAAHSAAIRSSPASLPSRTKQRAAPRAVPASSTATRMTESRSSSERTLRAIDDSRRSRSSASSSADAERARSRASAASAATVRSGPSSSGENARCSWVVATASTAITRSPATSGTKAALRAPTLWATALLTSGEVSVS